MSSLFVIHISSDNLQYLMLTDIAEVGGTCNPLSRALLPEVLFFIFLSSIQYVTQISARGVKSPRKFLP
jgi:hypothetical protein